MDSSGRVGPMKILFLRVSRVLAILLLCRSAFVYAQTGQRPAVLLISIDGLRPDYVTQTDQHGLKIPNLRRMLRDGAHADAVRGVLPTVTYPSHTTILTGVSPVRHGIYQNAMFDPLGKNMDGWYWYSQDIRVPTLWEGASKSGYTVGSINWPVSVAARSLNYVIPEYWRASNSEDVKLIAALSTPGLLDELQKRFGPHIVDFNNAVPADWMRTHYAEVLIREKHVDFLTLHLASLDHFEHETGPTSSQSLASLEEIDKMVGVLEETMRAQFPQTVVCVVSDHGFIQTDHQFNPKIAFIKAGLMTVSSKSGRLAVTEWKAEPWTTGGGAFVVLENPADTSTRMSVEHLLHELAADPANGIENILDRQAIAALGGTPDAEFFIDMKAGFLTANNLDGPLVREAKTGGAHGYSPSRPDMRASFFIIGRGVRPGLNLGDIDMRSIAPTLAKILGASLPAADLPPLEISAPAAPQRKSRSQR